MNDEWLGVVGGATDIIFEDQDRKCSKKIRRRFKSARRNFL